MQDFRFDLAWKLEFGALDRLVSSVRTKELVATVESYARNMERVQSIHSLVSGLASVIESLRNGRRGQGSVYNPAVAAQQMPRDFGWEEPPIQRGTRDNDAELFERAFDLIHGRARWKVETLENGIRSNLSSMIIGTWTAFEILASDLWVAAVDAHPYELSQLKAWKWVTQKPRERKAKKNKPPKCRSSGLPRKYPRILGLKKGKTLAEDKIRFASLRSIKESYMSAFYCHHGGIKKVLESRELKVLASVRNLLVHKSGIVDGRFLKQINGTSSFLRQPVGRRLPICGQTTGDFVESGFRCSSNLIKEVDQWLANHPWKLA